MAAADFNNDETQDLAVVNEDNADISVLLGNGNRAFQNRTVYNIGTSSASVTVDGFNDDSKPYPAMVNGDDTSISVVTGTP